MRVLETRGAPSKTKPRVSHLRRPVDALRLLCSEKQRKRLGAESNLDLDKKGISLKERTGLKKYLEALRNVLSAVEQVNSTALLCPMLISMGAWQDLMRALQRILRGSSFLCNGKVATATKEGEEAQGATTLAPRRVEIDPVLTAGKNHILKRTDFPLSDIVGDCQVCSVVGISVRVVCICACACACVCVRVCVHVRRDTCMHAYIHTYIIYFRHGVPARECFPSCVCVQRFSARVRTLLGAEAVSGGDSPDATCEHENVNATAKVCTSCLRCTAHGSSCKLHADRRVGATECGCGDGDAGCAKCGLCKFCQEAEHQPAKTSPESWAGRNAAALAALRQALKLEHFPSRTPGAIPLIKSQDTRRIDMQMEADDPLQINEITLHFIALRLPQHVRAVFVTLDFYSLPRQRTGPIKVATAKCDGMRSLHTEGIAPLVPNSINPGVGNSIRFTVTPEMAGTTQPADFAHFLCTHDMDIDVWDAESCLALGTLRVSELHRALRQGESAVQMLASPSFVPSSSEASPVVHSMSGRDSQFDHEWTESGARQPGALIRIINRGRFAQNDAQKPVHKLGESGADAAEAQIPVPSWRTGMAHHLPPIDEPKGASEKSGMAAILHARKYRLAKDKGKIAEGNVVPIGAQPTAVAQDHASALKAFRQNPAYRMQDMRQIIQQLSVQHVQMYPVFGQSKCEHKQAIENPHDHIVVCMAAITQVDADKIPLEMREDVIRSLRIGGGVLSPTQENEVAMPDAQSWVLQPRGKVFLTVTLDNKPEHWQLNTFFATIQISLLRQTQLASQYDLRVTVKPLPVVFDRHFRFVVDSREVKRKIHISHSRLQAPDQIRVRTVPETGVESKVVLDGAGAPVGDATAVAPDGAGGAAASAAEAAVGSAVPGLVFCQISVDMSHLPNLEKSAPGAGAADKAKQLPGWEKQQVRPLFVLLCDNHGEIVLRWKIELVIVDHAVTDAFNKSVELILAPLIQDRLFGSQRQFYSSNCRRLPCYLNRKVAEEDTDSEEPSPKFALARGFSSPVLLLLVTQRQMPHVEGNPHGRFFGNSQLLCDDMPSVRLFRMMRTLEKILADLRAANQTTCSDIQWKVVRESGLMAFKEAAQVVEKSVRSQDDVRKILRVLNKTLLQHRNSVLHVGGLSAPSAACADGSFVEMPRDEMFQPGAESAPDKASQGKLAQDKKAQGQTNAQKETSVMQLEAHIAEWQLLHGTVVAAWRVCPAGAAAGIGEGSDEEELEDFNEDAPRKRVGPKPVIRFEPVFHLWAVAKAGEANSLARRRQAEALEKHVYKGDHSAPAMQRFSEFARNQELVRKYPDLTKDDRPAGPFLEAVKAETRIFVLTSAQGEGSNGFLSRDEMLQSLMDVAWSYEWSASGQYLLRTQGLVYEQSPLVKVSSNVSDLVKLGKDAGGKLLPTDVYCRARKRIIATFSKVLSWGIVGSELQLYYGKGVDLEEVQELRAAGAAVGGVEHVEAARTDDDQPEPLECVVLTGAPMHLDLENFECKDFTLDAKSGARRRPLSTVRFPHFFSDCCVMDGRGGLCIPSYTEAKSNKTLGFVAMRPAGIKIKGRRVRIFSDDLRRHGWNSGVVLDYFQREDGVWTHKVRFDDDRVEDLVLDAMPSSIMELVPDLKCPDEDVLVNTKALLACLVEDLHLVLTAFAEMVNTFNRKSNRMPELKGFLKATALPYMLRFAPGARQTMMELIEPLLQKALQIVLLEDSGGFCKFISAIEVPVSWKSNFPRQFGTMHHVAPNHTATTSAGQVEEHVIDISFGRVQDVLVVDPRDLWPPSGMRLPGIVTFSEALALPYSAKHTGWTAEDCVESFVGDHTDVRLLQSFWFNHSLLDETHIKPVTQPIALSIGLELEDLREADMLFRSIDADGSKTLETAECQSYLRELGYLDEEIDTFFLNCDENSDGVIEWREFLLGAVSLYKPSAKDAAKGNTAGQQKAVSTVLPITLEGSESATKLFIDSDMSFKDVLEEATRAMEDAAGLPRRPSIDSTATGISNSTFVSLGTFVSANTLMSTNTRLSVDLTSSGSIFFEYTNVKVARELMRVAADIFDQIDVDKSNSLERNELMGRLRLPPPEGWGFAEFQVDDFIKAADADNNNSIDRGEFIAAATKILLTEKSRSVTPHLDAAAGDFNHIMSGLKYKGKPLRLRCGNEKEWLAMRACVFPTREQRVHEISEFKKRLGLPPVDDTAEADLKLLRKQKHEVQRTCTMLKTERETVQRTAAKAKALLTSLNSSKAELETLKKKDSKSKGGEGAGSQDATAAKKVACGLKWLKVGETQPVDGQNLARSDLADALKTKAEFTQEEWEAFGVLGLCLDHFVKSGGSYFRPVGIDDLQKDVASAADKERALDQKLAEEESRLQEMAERLNKARADAAEGKAERQESFVVAHLEVLEKMNEDELKAECADLNSTCLHKDGHTSLRPPGSKWRLAGSEKPQTGTEIKNPALATALGKKLEFTAKELETFKIGKRVSYDSYIQVDDKYLKPVAPDVLVSLAEQRYERLQDQLHTKEKELEEDDADEHRVSADVRALSCRKYNLRCLLHPSVKLTSETPSEWKETKDKNTQEASWTNVYTGEQKLQKPAVQTVLLNTKSKAAFLRRFKDWKRTGRVLPVTDTTTWGDLKQKGLSALLQERLELLCTSSVTVRTEEDWQKMKATLLTFSHYSTRILVAREKVPKQKKAAVPLPVGWEQHDILPQGWVHTFDEASGRSKFINGNDASAAVRWDFPLEHLDTIKWPDGVSEATGPQLRQALGEPPSSVDDRSKVYVNWKTQQIAWLPPKATADICQVRVRIAPGKDGKAPEWLAGIDAFIPIVLMEQPAGGGAVKELPRKEPSPWRLPYMVEKGGALGGFTIKPALDWREMQALLKDNVEPKGTDRVFLYVKEGARADLLTRVQSQREWDECVQSYMLQLRAQLLSAAAAAAAAAAGKGGGAVNSLRMQIFPENYPDLRIEVLDSLLHDEKNLLPVEGNRMIDGVPVEVRAVLPVKQNTTFAVLADELQDLCKAPCVFRFEEPKLVNSDAPWLATLEQIFAPVGVMASRQHVCIAEKAADVRLAQVTLVFEDMELDLEVDEGTPWLQLVAQLRRVAGASTVGLLHDGIDVRDEGGYRQMLQRVLKDRFAPSNLKRVEDKVLNALRVLWKDDPKQGAIASEFVRRKIAADEAGAEVEIGTEKMLTIKVEGCQVWRDQGLSKIYVQGQLELGLRNFRFMCREATADEDNALPCIKGKKQASSKPIKATKDTDKPQEKPVAFEIMRRTRKGKQKIKGLLVLPERGERIFALSSTGPSVGLMGSYSCCPRAQVGESCCRGLAWDLRATILHAPVTVNEDTNVFCYNGPALAKVKGGGYSLAQLAAALWHGVMASGALAHDLAPALNPFEFGLTLDKAVLATGWEEVPGAAGKEAVYKNIKTGKLSEPAHGKPLKLVCSGHGEFVALNSHEKCTLITEGVYWKGKNCVQVPPEGLDMCFSGPRRVAVPPASYTLATLQECIQQLVSEEKHVSSSTEDTASKAIFSFTAANHLSSKDALPPGWVARVFDSAHALANHEPRPPAEGNQPGRVFYIHLATKHAQWEKPFHRVQLEISRMGYQANMAASSIRGLLGFAPCYCPPVLTDTFSPAGGARLGVPRADGKGVGAVKGGGAAGARFLAQAAPRITWSELKDVLAQVVSGLVRVDLEFVAEDSRGVEAEVEGEAENAPVRVATEDAWQGLLEYLRAKSHVAAPGEQTEVEVDLVLLKTTGSSAANVRPG